MARPVLRLSAPLVFSCDFAPMRRCSQADWRCGYASSARLGCHKMPRVRCDPWSTSRPHFVLDSIGFHEVVKSDFGIGLGFDLPNVMDMSLGAFLERFGHGIKDIHRFMNGLAAAKKQGRTPGRPPLEPETILRRSSLRWAQYQQLFNHLFTLVIRGIG